MEEIKRLRFVADDGHGTYGRVRKGSRALLIMDGKLLLGKEHIGGYCCIPGGGHEGMESLEETCRREVAEEMGILVRVGREVAVVESLWKDLIYENHFFLCTYEGETEICQTSEEAQMELGPIWVTIEEAREIFSDQDPGRHGMAWIGCYKRDLWILDEILSH